MPPDLVPAGVCGRCKVRPAMLPEALADGRPSGSICRECFTHMFTLGFKAMGTAFGPLPQGLPVEFLLDSELLWVDAALQEPRTVDLNEIRQRYSKLMAEKYEVSPERMRVDEDTLRRWPFASGGE